MSYEPIPPVTPPLGRGGMSNYRHDTLHEKILENSDRAARSQPKGIHKLMRSGTRKGKFVKFFYQMIWDVTYR